MVAAKDIVVASLEAGKEFFRPLSGRERPHGEGAHTSVVVPIRSLGANHRERIAAHLKALDPQDRYLRFGYAAHDEHIDRYVDGLDFERDDIYGIYNRRVELIAMAHLACAGSPLHPSCSEFGVSVLKAARGRGYGSRLFERAVMHARNDGVELMFIHALSENTPMLRIATRAGAHVVRDGSESEAHLMLPPATLDSRMAEMVEERLANMDYSMKVQAKQFWEFLSNLQEIRQGVRKARHQSAE
jgi:GNAT superfamily N-acetyltransferase